MAARSKIFGKLRSTAMSVGGIIQKKVENLTETVEKKLEEYQEDLERERSKTVVSKNTFEQPQRWKPSAENPDGEIIPVVETPVNVLSTTPPLTPSPIATTPPVEIPTIRHKGGKYRIARKNGLISRSPSSLSIESDPSHGRMNNSIQRKDYRLEIERCLNDIIDEIVNRELICECLNDIIGVIETVDKSFEKTSTSITIEPDSSEQEESVSPKSESDQEIVPIDESISGFESVDDAVLYEQKTTVDDDPVVSQVDDIQIKTVESGENSSIISEHTTKTPPSEFEDSSGEWTVPKIERHESIEKQPKSSSEYDEIKRFILQIKDDYDEDEDGNEDTIPIPTEPDIIKDYDSVTSTDLDQPNDVVISIPTSMPCDTQDKIPHELSPDVSSIESEPFEDENNELTDLVPVQSQTPPVETRRYPTVNCHSLPSGTKVEHITCSSTYIYICTNNKKILYVELNMNDMSEPFKWKQHSDMAERLAVSISNRTVWRLLNKQLYASDDPLRFPPIGSNWNEIKVDRGQSLISMSVSDQCGWYIKNDGTLWLIRDVDKTYQSVNVACPFNLNRVVCFSEKVGVTTDDGIILIRIGCTDECPEGDGWIFVQHNFGPIDDFLLVTNENIICIIDTKNHLWIHQWSSDKGFREILCNNDYLAHHPRFLMCANTELLCITDGEEQIHIFSDCLTGVEWKIIQENTNLQQLIGAFSDDNSVWALTAEKMIHSLIGRTLEKPRRAQYLTQATFVPDNSSQSTVLWALDESCNIYVRPNLQENTQWEQLDQIQFEWNRRLVHIVCNNSGVWAVDDQGSVHFRHGHIAGNEQDYLNESSLLSAAWISIPGDPRRYRSFSQIYCGPADWMVYATDNKQTVYARVGINEENPIGTSWKAFEECSALQLAISERTLWVLTSCGQIECRENISESNPIGTRSTTLPRSFRSLTVSMDDSQVWALDSRRNLLQLDRFTVLFEK